MRIGFLILAHRYPDQLKDLIRSLMKFPSSRIYIHVDKKSDSLFQQLQQLYSDHNQVVFLEERYPVYWGSFNQIRATFALMKKANAFGTEDFFMLLSGQDFLIKKPDLVLDFLRNNPAKQFVVHFKLPDSQWKYGGMNRLGHYSFDIPGRPWLTNKLNAFLEKIQVTFRLQRNVSFQQYGGSNWFNLTREALSYSVNFVLNNPKFLNSFRYSRCADEMFVQSILMNSAFKNQVVSDDLRYIDWGSGPEYPRILRDEDLEKMLNAENKFFGRKFDATIDSAVLNKLNHYLEF